MHMLFKHLIWLFFVMESEVDLRVHLCVGTCAILFSQCILLRFLHIYGSSSSLENYLIVYINWVVKVWWKTTTRIWCYWYFIRIWYFECDGCDGPSSLVIPDASLDLLSVNSHIQQPCLLHILHYSLALIFLHLRIFYGIVWKWKHRWGQIRKREFWY